MRSTRWMRALVGSAVAALAVFALALGAEAQPKVDDANGRIYPPNAKPFGMTYGEWSGAWWQWALSIPAKAYPPMDPDGAQCGTLQRGQVWFLAGTGAGSVTRTCTIPSGRAILIPIINYLNDYPCPEPPPFQPAPGQSIDAFLAAGAAQVVDFVDLLEAELDGRPVVNLTTFRARSPLIGFTAAANLQVFDSCITGSPQLGVSDGYWIMLKPPSVGTHTLRIKGRNPLFPVTVEATYQLTIGGQ